MRGERSPLSPRPSTPQRSVDRTGGGRGVGGEGGPAQQIVELSPLCHLRWNKPPVSLTSCAAPSEHRSRPVIVDLLHLQRVLLDKFPPRLDFLAHEHPEHDVGFEGVV